MRRLTVLLAAAGAAAAALPASSPAANAVYGSEQPTGGSVELVAGGVRLTETCAEGRAVVGLSGRIGLTSGDVSPFGQVVIDDLFPDPDLSRATGLAISDADGVPAVVDDWDFSFGATCVEPPAGLQHVAATSVLDSNTKTVSARCPLGKQVLATGAQIHGGAGHVLLDDVQPAADLRSVTVTGTEIAPGADRLWALSAHATCVDPLPGLQRTAAATSFDSQAGKNISASCPDGLGSFSGGTAINGGAGHVKPVELIGNSVAVEDENGYAAPWSLTDYAICAPFRGRERTAGSPINDVLRWGLGCPGTTGGGFELDDSDGTADGRVSIEDYLSGVQGDGVGVEAFEDETGTDANWSAFIYGVCGTPVPGRERAFKVGPLSSSNKATTVACPGDKRVTTAYGALNVDGHQAYLDDLRPSPDLRSVTVQGVEDETGYDSSWSVTASAICVDPPPGLERVAATSELSSENKSATATCPAPKRLLGTGADINGASGQVLFTAIVPDEDLHDVTVRAAEDRTGYSGPWSLTAYAICADP